MLNSLLAGVLIWQSQVVPLAQSGQKSQGSDAQLSKAEIQHQKDLAYDTDLGKKFSAEVEKQEKLSTNKEYQERVNRIGQEIAAIAQVTQVDVFWGDHRLNKFNYTFKVLQGPKQVNAFSLPGGFIYVYEGLVKYAESDDEIAAVLAHEISHSEERHIATLAHDQQKVENAALIAILAAIATGRPDAISGVILGGQLTVASFTSGWSVRAEQAADHGGVQYLTHSKYNPTAMLTFMERLSLDEHSDPAMQPAAWGIYQTHPPGRERAVAVLKDLQTYGVTVERSTVTTRFRVEVKPGQDNGVEIWFNKRKLYTFGGADALRRADDSATRLNHFFDREPNLYDVSFDGKSILGNRTTLFEVLPDDAQAEKSSVDDLGTKARDAIKGSLYNYAFNVWAAK